MKKKRLGLLITAVLIIFAFTFTACDDSGKNPTDKTVTNIALVNTSLRTDYTVGEKADLNGAKLSVAYSGNTEEIVAVTAEMVSGFDTSSAGEKSAVVTYANLKTKYYYLVSEKRPEPEYFETLQNADGSLTVLSVMKNCPDTIFVPKTLGGKNVTTIASNAFSEAAASRVIVEEGVTTISAHAFANNPYIDYITLPDSVTELGKYAFWDCSSLEEVTLGNGITELAKGVFFECRTLVRAILPSTLETIGENAFYSCSALDEINLPETVTTVNLGAFRSCSVLKSLSLPSVTAINENTFKDCYALKNVNIPKVTSIGNNAFQEAGLNNFVFPVGLQSIGDMAFSNVQIKSLVLPEGLVSIGERAFENLESTGALTELSLPSTLETIGRLCFAGENVLLKITIAEPCALTVIPDSAFARCAMLTEFKVPSSITTIDNSAFDGAGYLLEGDDCFALDLSEAINLTTIDSEAFRGAKITGTINIPKSVTYVGLDAFSTTKIDALVFPADSALTDANNLAYRRTFTANCRNLKKIVFPPISEYRNGWTANIIIEEIDLTNTAITNLSTDIFYNHGSLTTVRLPQTLTNISHKAFSGKTVSQIFYNGTQAEWDTITKASSWDKDLADGYTVSFAS